ncbi:MAG: CshA/CshB family fibrillar adhesin-related protein [Novosphingobium sp.]
MSLFRTLLALCLAALGLLALPGSASAASCYVATAQGSTGPANWQTYCWLDFTGYNDTTARSGTGQSFSYTLSDGTTLTFNLKVTTSAALSPVAAPSWSGAAVGNTAFLGISGRPVLYQTAGGVSTVTISGITLTPPAGASTVTSFMFVAADAESTNDGETLRFQTNGGNWQVLDQVGPTSGSTYPSISGTGTQAFTETGATGTVGAYIVGSAAPGTVTATLTGGGLQGVMFAVRFAAIRLNLAISGARIDAADQFEFAISSTSGATTYASGTSSGTGLGPFTAASLSTASAFPLTLSQGMASGSASALAKYRSVLTCTNGVSGSSTPLPSGVVTTSYNFGSLQFGDLVSCQFVNTPYPHLQLTKALGTGGRRFTGDQFVMSLQQGETVAATTTTTGSGTTVGNASTPQTLVTAGASYTFNEAGAGTTSLVQYTAAMTCVNANGASTTVLPTTVGGAIVPQLGDVVRCTITNTRLGNNATLTVTKSSTLVSDPANGTASPKAIPGAVVRYAIQVSNTGNATVTANTVFIRDSLPATIAVGTSSAPAFTQGSPTSALTFNAASDVRYSNSATAPASFAACSYTPTAAYDPAVTYVCLNPKGTMAASTGTPTSFTITFTAQVK